MSEFKAPAARLDYARSILANIGPANLEVLLDPDLLERVERDGRGEASARAVALIEALGDSVGRRLETPNCFTRLCPHVRAAGLVSDGATIDLPHGTGYCEAEDCVEQFTGAWRIAQNAACEICGAAGAETQIVVPFGGARLLANVCRECAAFAEGVAAWRAAP